MAPDVARVVGLVLLAAFGLWNGWALSVMAANRTALLPGGATRVLSTVDRFDSAAIRSTSG